MTTSDRYKNTCCSHGIKDAIKGWGIVAVTVNSVNRRSVYRQMTYHMNR